MKYLLSVLVLVVCFSVYAEEVRFAGEVKSFSEIDSKLLDDALNEVERKVSESVLVKDMRNSFIDELVELRADLDGKFLYVDSIVNVENNISLEGYSADQFGAPVYFSQQVIKVASMNRDAGLLLVGRIIIDELLQHQGMPANHNMAIAIMRGGFEEKEPVDVYFGAIYTQRANQSAMAGFDITFELKPINSLLVFDFQAAGAAAYHTSKHYEILRSSFGFYGSTGFNGLYFGASVSSLSYLQLPTIESPNPRWDVNMGVVYRANVGKRNKFQFSTSYGLNSGVHVGVGLGICIDN